MADIFELFKQISASSSATTEPISYIVVGLGNPGMEYESTRHNAGFITIDSIADRCSAKINRAKFQGLCEDVLIASKRVLFLKPQTYMNLSGESVREAAAFYKIPSENIIVICDDVNFDVGVMRIRKKGSDGGQKGVRSIISCLGTDNFPRIKIGVGKKPNPDYDMADWVLSKFTSDEQKLITETAKKTFDAVSLMISGKCDEAMAKFN